MGIWEKIFGKKSPKAPSPEDENDTLPDEVVVTDVLDLHGFFPEQVPEMLADFLENARRLNLRTLRIIHGKGKSKLKWMVTRELEKYSFVASFKDAPPELGGWGATIIYLKEEKKDETSD